MSSTYQLNRGVKSLNLTLSTPTDAVTGRVRNDLSGVKVWYSTTTGFNPNNSEGTLSFNGLSLDITISNLLSNTVYYVRYAFISAIDPTVITISNEISQTTYDETVSVYGNLTKPSAVIPTASDGQGGDYSVASGVFKVYNYSENITTGKGVQYGIVSGSIVGGLDASIDLNTGVYSVNGLSTNYGSIMFSATYGSIVIETTLVVTKSRAGIDGTNAKLLKIIATGNSFLFKDTSATVADTVQVTLSANLQNLTATVLFTAIAYNTSRVSLGAISFTSDTTNNAITISNTQFNPTGYNNAVAYVVVTASYSTLSDIITLYRINNGTEQIIVELSNESHTIPASYDGSTEPAGYIGSGTTIKVKEGNNYLRIDNTSPYDNGTWTITNTNGVNITPDTTPGIYNTYIDYDTHSNMTQNSAYIDYTITGKTSTGSAFSIIRRQSFAKSVGGVPGFTSSMVNLTTTEAVFIKFKNGTYSSNFVTIYTDLQNITDPVYAWTVNGVAQAGATAQQFVFNRPSTVGVYTIGVTVTSSTDATVDASDVMSIAFIEEGSDAYTFLFKDPNIVVSANSLGVVENGITNITNHIIGAKGIALLVPGTFGAAGVDITYSVYGTPVNCTANMTSITGTWNHEFNIGGDIFSNASVTNAKVVIECKTPSGASFLQTCYIVKVKTGATGPAGANALIADLISEADVVTTLSDGTGYTLPTGNVLRLYSGGLLVPTNNVSYGGTTTKNGLTLTISNDTDTKGAITLTGTAWTSDQEIFNVTATSNNLTYNAAYTIAKSKAGSDAVFVDLLSEAELVSTLTDGTEYTLPTGNSMRLFKGGNQVTTDVAYKVTSTNTNTGTQNGLTLTIDTSTGAITLTGTAWTTNQESFTLTATYGGIAYTYKYKIAKSRAGSAGIAGSTATLAFLTTTELVFIKRKDGTYSSDYVTLTTFTQNIPDPIFTWTAPDGTVTVKDSTLIANAQQFVFNRPATLGSYLIRVKVTSKTSPSLNEAQDAMSIIFLEEGSDAYNFAFKDPYVFLSANSSGVLEGGVANSVNHIIGAKGMALLTPGTYGAAGVDITYSVVTAQTDPNETNVTTNCTAEMGSIVGTWNQQFTVSGAFFSNSSIRTAKVVIKARVAGSSTYFLYTTYYTKQIAGDTGTNAYITQLLQDNVTVNTNSAGTAYTLPTNNKMSVISGNAEVTSGVTYGVTGGTTVGTATSLNKNGLTLTIGASTGAIALTGASWTSNTETFPLTATLGTSTFNKSLSVTKAKDGATGAASRSVDLSTVAQAFTYNTAGTTPSPTSTVLTATAQNTTGTVYYEFLVGSITVQNTTTNTYTYTPTTAFTSMPQNITVKLREGTNTSTVLATDVMSMIGIKPGTNGVDAISGFLTNESSTVPTANDGSGGSYTNSGGTFKVFNGITDVTGSASYSVLSSAGVAISIAASGVYTVTNTSADQGTATLRAVYGGVIIDKIYDISRARTGAAGASVTGAAGPKSTSGYIYYSISQGSSPATPSASSFNFSTGAFGSLSANWGTNITMTGNGIYWASRYTVTESSSGSGTGTPSFSAAYTHTNFSGLVTFTDQSSALSNYVTGTALATAGYTTINGGNITSGTISADKISSGTFTATTGNTFSFGTGTFVGAADGVAIATVGIFKTTLSTSAALVASGNQAIAFCATNVSNDPQSPAAGFTNRGGFLQDNITAGANRSIAVFAAYAQAGFLQLRAVGGVANNASVDTNTKVYARICFEDDVVCAGQFGHKGSGNKVNLGLSDYALVATGPAKISGNLTVGSLTVGNTIIDTNGGGGGGVQLNTGYSIGDFGLILIEAGNSSLYAYSARVVSSTGIPGYATRLNHGGNGLWTQGDIFYAGVNYGASSRRHKENILPIDIGLNFILSLDPIKYTVKGSSDSKRVGFIAEDFPDARFVLNAPVDMADPSKGTQIEALDYISIVTPLVKAVQELNAKILELTTEIEILKAK